MVKDENGMMIVVAVDDTGQVLDHGDLKSLEKRGAEDKTCRYPRTAKIAENAKGAGGKGRREPESKSVYRGESRNRSLCRITIRPESATWE